MALVTLDQVKAHLRIDSADDDDDLDLKMEQASDIVLDYLKTDETWNEATVPRPIHAAVLLTVQALYEREPDVDLIKPDGAVARLLHRFRDPAMA